MSSEEKAASAQDPHAEAPTAFSQILSVPVTLV